MKTSKSFDASSVEEGVVCQIPLHLIRRFSKQPRENFDPVEMQELVASIALVGQQKPIIVRRIQDKDDPKHPFELVDGERRWRACGIAKKETVLTEVRQIETDFEQYLVSVVSNFGNAEHTDLEIAHAIEKLRSSEWARDFSHGEQIAKIASIFVRSEPWVYGHLALLRLTPKVQAMMSTTMPEKERLTFSFALFISSLHHDLQLEIAQKVMEEKMSLRRARLYAKQVAEKAGLTAGSNRGRVSGRPSKSWASLRTMVRLTQERLEGLLLPEVLLALKQKSSKELTTIQIEIEQCIAQLTQLKVGLNGTTLLPADSAKTTRVVPSASQSITSPTQRLVVLPTPPSPTVSFQPSIIPSPKVPRDGSLELAYKVLTAMFYVDGEPRVNLSRKRLQEIFPDKKMDDIVRTALEVGRQHWRMASKGGKGLAAREKLIELMNRLQRVYGSSRRKFGDVLKEIENRDFSEDPVSLEF